jgi:hypothetical protein
LLAGGLEQLGRVVQHSGQRDAHLLVAEEAVCAAEQIHRGIGAALQHQPRACDCVDLADSTMCIAVDPACCHHRQSVDRESPALHDAFHMPSQPILGGPLWQRIACVQRLRM